MSTRFPSCFCSVSLVLILGLLSACDTQVPAALPPDPPEPPGCEVPAFDQTAETPPTGTIVFSSKRTGRYQIYTMNPDGSDLRQLTFGTYSSYIPRWSPDGQQIVFTSDSLGSTAGSPLYLMNADGTDIRALKVLYEIKGEPELQLGIWPAWSPDGTKIAFGYYHEVLLYDFATDEVTALTNNLQGNESPSWSPDGSRMVFVSERDSAGGGDYFQELYMMDADGGNQRRLTFEKTLVSTPIWSPDGEWIAFSPRGELQLFHVGCETIQPIDVSIPDEFLFPSAWSPDGRKLLVFSNKSRDRHSLYMVDVRQQQIEPLLEDETAFFADWSIN